jgi:hypothetical protein
MKMSSLPNDGGGGEGGGGMMMMMSYHQTKLFCVVVKLCPF